jgi:hypothetical protein
MPYCKAILGKKDAETLPCYEIGKFGVVSLFTQPSDESFLPHY